MEWYCLNIKIVLLALIGVSGLAYLLVPEQIYKRFRVVFIVFLAILAVLSFGTYIRFGEYFHGNKIHYHDVAHYYFGSKYSQELGYTNLYRCICLADYEILQDAGHSMPDEMKHFEIRHLEDGTLRPLEDIVSDPDDRRKCMDGFTPARWAQFKQDVSDYYRVQNHYNLYDRCGDRGFNGSPFWSLYAGSLANLLPVKSFWLIAASWLDIMFLAAGFLLLGFAFGVETALMSVVFYFSIFFNNNHFIHFSFLRYDWMGITLAGLALLKLRRYRLSGVFLGLAAAIRLFPMLLILGPGIKFIADLITHKKADRSLLRFALAWLLTLIVTVSLSMAVYGPERYGEYFDKLKIHSHLKTSTRIGLEYVIHQYRGDTLANTVDSLFGEKAALAYRSDESVRTQRVVIRWSIVAGMFILLVFAFRKQEEHESALLSCVPAFLLLNLTVYYCVFFVILIPLLLSRKTPRAGAFLWMIFALSSLAMYGPLLEGNVSDSRINEQSSLLLFVMVLSITLSYALRDTRLAERLKKMLEDTVIFCKLRRRFILSLIAFALIIIVSIPIIVRLNENTPVMEDWQRAFLLLKENGFNTSNDLVIVSPFSSYREFTPAMTSIGDIRFLDDPAANSYWKWNRVWIISEPALFDENSFITRPYRLSQSWISDGGILHHPVRVLMYTFENPMKSGYKLSRNLDRATVSMETDKGSIDCPLEKSGRFVCSKENDWNYVGMDTQIFMGRNRSGIWIHPAEKSINLHYPEAPMGERLSIETGLTDFAVMLPDGAPVILDVYVSGDLLESIIQPNSPGWCEHSLDTSRYCGQSVNLEFRVHSENTGRRHFMMNGEVLHK